MTTEVDLVERVTRMATAAEGRLEEAKAAHAAALDEVRRTVFELAAVMPAEYRQDCIWELYWRCPMAHVAWIAEAFGIKWTNLVSREAGPCYMNATCGCGRQFEAMLSSRSSTVARCGECEDAWRRRSQQANAQRAREEAERAARLAVLKAMPYAEYLRTPEWQEARRRALYRAGYRCQTCNGQGRLDVHHRTYERRGNERNSDLTVLCRPCHERFHDQLPLPPVES